MLVSVTHIHDIDSRRREDNCFTQELHKNTNNRLMETCVSCRRNRGDEVVVQDSGVFG